MIMMLKLYGNILLLILDSIVIEYADNGDLFQKICEHQKKGTEFNEIEIWKVLI
jgi:hypothetical protein